MSCDSQPCSCGCCAPEPDLASISNPPGQRAIAYRTGVYGSFLKRLLDRIHSASIEGGPNDGARPLRALTTRAKDDPSIALLDAWAVVADVLTFYQERIANEGFLRTATERRSVLELAREIGYELAPGTAASVLLQFTVEDIIAAVPGAANSPFQSGKVLIPKGSQVQSVPSDGQLPQIFETSQDFEARVAWNAIAPRLERPADLAISGGKLYLLGTRAGFSGASVKLAASKVYLLTPATEVDPAAVLISAIEVQHFYLAGVNTNLSKGDRMVLVGERNGDTSAMHCVVRRVETDAAANRTRVQFGASATTPSFAPVSFPPASFGASKVAFSAKNASTYVLSKSVSDSDLGAFLEFNGWSDSALESVANHPSAASPGQFGALALRAPAGFFGNNAQPYDALPDPSKALRGNPYPQNWDTPNNGKGRLIWTDSQGNAWPDGDAYLERTFPKVEPESWVLFESPTAGAAVFRVKDVSERSIADYGLSGRATGLTLHLQQKVKGIGMSPPAVVTRDTGQVDVFAVGLDGNLYYRWLDVQKKWHGPENLGGGNLANAPSAVSWGPGRVDVFAIGDGKLYHWFSDNNSQFQGPINRGGAKLANSPSAVSLGAGLLDVFAIGTDGVLYHSSSVDNQNWQGPVSRGGGDLINSPSAVANGALDQLDVVAIGNGGLYHAMAVKIVNQTVFLPPMFRAIGSFQYSPSLVRLPIDGQLYAAVVTTAGQLEVYGPPLFFPGFGLWLPLGIVDGSYVGSPATFPYGLNQIGILAIREDGNLTFALWDQVLNFGQVLGVVPMSLGGDGNLTSAPAVFATTMFDASVAAVGAAGHWFYTALQSASWTALKDLGNGHMIPFLTRTTTAFVQSEQLALAPFPIVQALSAGSTAIMLDRLVLGLGAGQSVSLTGARADSSLVQHTELLLLEDVSHDGGYTTLHLTQGLKHSYRRDSVSINANLAGATHGATVQQVLGSADGSKPAQTFELKRPPLTFVPAPTPTGVETTLSVRVNDVEWKAAPTLAGLAPRDRAYTVRLSDEGVPMIAFGDPAARPRSGSQNIRATYRTGIGRAGNVKASSLSMLLSRPPGLRGVVNPLPAEGGADPQPASQARRNAPLAVLTLGRIVSILDYENYARAFAGVGKAQAVAIWSGESRIVCLTVATDTGKSLTPALALYGTLLASITEFHDPVQIFQLAGFQKVTFNLTAALRIDEQHHSRPDVNDAVRARLARAFSFAEREFGQAVTAAEIVALIQGVRGVLGCALMQLYVSGDPSGPSQKEAPAYLPALPARFEKGAIQPAQLLLVNLKGVALEEMEA